MPEPITLRVPGIPAPQGSKSAFVVAPKGGRPRAIITDGKKGSPQKMKLDAWRDAVREAAARWSIDHHDPGPLEGPVRLRVVFYLQKPASSPRWRWLPWQKPDLDKLLRSTCDSLTGLIVRDDAQVVEILARKVFALDRAPGAVIQIEALAATEDERGHAWVAGGSHPTL